MEDFVSRYLKEHVVKIWPDGWMKLEDLQKQYEKKLEIFKRHTVTIIETNILSFQTTCEKAKRK